MPRVDIDYSNSIFYIIQCIDDTITERFVGHTTNFVQKKYGHKQAVHNKNSHNLLYDTIRSHGGWYNWSMEILEKSECEHIQDVHEKEKKLAGIHGAHIISREQLPCGSNNHGSNDSVVKKTDHVCSVCIVYFQTQKAHMVHNQTKKHKKMASMLNNLKE